jgi:hypothetical protein
MRYLPRRSACLLSGCQSDQRHGGGPRCPVKHHSSGRISRNEIFSRFVVHVTGADNVERLRFKGMRSAASAPSDWFRSYPPSACGSRAP